MLKIRFFKNCIIKETIGLKIIKRHNEWGERVAPRYCNKIKNNEHLKNVQLKCQMQNNLYYREVQ